jgi:hypothetical protein
MTRRTAKAEAMMLALVALVPFVPHAIFLSRHPVPRFSMYGDYAIIEQVIRFVGSGRTLVGPYSRFGFSHPGPLYFYFLAPIYWAMGGESRGLFVGALVLNAMAAATIVFALRALASRAHAMAGLLLVLVWTIAFGDVLSNFWNPLVIALPLVAYLVLAALFARGEVRAAVPGALLGVLVAQTHVGADIVVAGVGIASSVAFFRRGFHLGDRARTHVRAAVAIVAVTALPILIDQLTAREGNLTRLAKFFFDPEYARQSTGTALRDWVLATSWLPERVLHSGLRTETGIPLAMSWQAIRSFPPGMWWATIVRVALACASWLVAHRTRDRLSRAITSIGLVSELASIVVLRGIVGDVFPYLLFWVSALAAVTWLGILSTACVALSKLRAAPVMGLAVTAALTWHAFVLQSAWLANNISLWPAEDPSLAAMYGPLNERLAKDHSEPVLHMEGAWTKATVLALELGKDGAIAYFPKRSEFMFGRPAPIENASHPLHVYVSDPWHALPQEPCLEPLASVDGTSIFISQSDLVRCP